MSKCKRCGKSARFLSDHCGECLAIVEEELRDTIATKERERIDFVTRAKAVQLTTAMTLANHRILQSVGIVTGEHAFGLGLFQGMSTGLSETFGGESSTTKGVLVHARVKALEGLQGEAARLHANAVIAVALDYSEFTSGGGKPLIFLVASGTAVVVAPEP